ncbi:MAG: NBR1-Ig-like domain-containing protein, partial [Chloroflexota bacterium]
QLATIEPTGTPLGELPAVCTDALQYIQDTTYPDGTYVSVGQPIEKQWLVQNSGDCDWNADYSLKLIDGYPALGAVSQIQLFPVPAGTQATISINFSAPYEAGTYQTAWQAYNAQGIPFGQPIYMLIQVTP